jgi:predicted 3-demethylubiquinone-9 3-methyltransferase (glyoxalase superfamily)
MPKQTPCLWFDGQGEEAAQFYCSVFPNSRITDVARYGKAGPGREGDVMVVTFELDGQPYVALNGGPQFTFDEAISFQIDCASQEEADHYWYALSIELLADPDPDRSARAMAAMLQMRRIDIAEVERAADAQA